MQAPPAGLFFSKDTPTPLRQNAQLQDDTATASLALLKSQQGRPGGGLKHVVHSLARQTGTFEVLSRANLMCYVGAIFRGYELQGLFAHLLDCNRILAKVFLQPN